MKINAIRGAITIDANTEDAIKQATVELFTTVMKENNLNVDDIAFLNFSTTKDINKAYPAKFIRTELGITTIPMMCYQEMDVENSLKMCLRLLIVTSTINNNFSAQHIYLKGASALRPDLAK